VSALLFGCDVSYCQAPSLVPWGHPRIDFGNVKATEGAARDSKLAAHVERIRAAKKHLSLYHFFRPDVEIQAQYEAFANASADVGYGNGDPLDVVPDIDVEYFGGHAVTRAWEPLLRDFVDRLTEAFYGQRPLLYLNWETWICLGSPEWALDCPLWVPFYMREGLTMPTGDVLDKRHVPGKLTDWSIWQFGAGRLFGNKQEGQESYSVDQNRARYLPLLNGEKLTKVQVNP
jgi:GH25 family lysozyme M1 (1,4-beta-N-acetylmuramidase)